MSEYECQQCGEGAKVIGVQDIDQHQNPTIAELVACEDCGYEIPKDTADKADLLEACEWIYAEAEYCPPQEKGDAPSYKLSKASFEKLMTAIAKAKKGAKT